MLVGNIYLVVLLVLFAVWFLSLTVTPAQVQLHHSTLPGVYGSNFTRFIVRLHSLILKSAR